MARRDTKIAIIAKKSATISEILIKIREIPFEPPNEPVPEEAEG